jgi:DNA primase
METVAEHLKGRHLDLDLHQPMIDEDERVATFFLYDLTGRTVGYHQYRPEGEKKLPNDHENGKYYTYRKGYVPWGVETLPLTPRVVFLTEGVFDACRFTKHGYSALAMLTNDPQRDVRNWLSLLGRRVVAVCDNDAAGKRLAKFGDVAVFTGEKDLGDESEEFVLDLLKEYGQ